MDLSHSLLLTCVGILAGWLNVLAGGGSLLSVPVMIFMGIPGPVANGTNRIAILAQNLVAVTAFWKRGFSDFKLSLTLAAAASIGAVFGASLGVELSGEWFNRILALVMIGILIIMWRGAGKTHANQSPTNPPQRLLLGHCLMVGAGFWGGFIQIGVGFILMPILSRVMGLSLVQTNMHKVFIVLVYTIIALVVFASQLDLLWELGLWLALGNAIGGWLGTHTTITRGEQWIRWVFNAALVTFIIKLLFF